MNSFGEALSSSDESAIDPRNPLDSGSDDEISFDELAEHNCATEQENLESEEEIIKDVIELIVKTVEDENASAIASNQEHPRPPEIIAIAMSCLSANVLKKRARKRVELLVKKERLSQLQNLSN